MLRSLIRLLTVGGTMLALCSGTAFAATVNCTDVLCPGTARPDTILGNALGNLIGGRGDADLIRGGGGGDQLIGDGQEQDAFDGADAVYGGADDDQLFGNGGWDLLSGGRGDDLIVASEAQTKGGEDLVRAGSGADEVDARDGWPDAIDCGPGVDSVFFDPVLDRATNCEIRNLPPA